MDEKAISIFQNGFLFSGFHIVPLELEGGELPLYKVAVSHLLTPRGRYVSHVCVYMILGLVCFE